MHSNHRHKIRFQNVYLKLNKWRAKILKNIDKKNWTWCIKLIRKQEIIFFFFAVRQKLRKLNIQNWLNYWLQSTKRNRIKQNFLSFTGIFTSWNCAKRTVWIYSYLPHFVDCSMYLSILCACLHTYIHTHTYTHILYLTSNVVLHSLKLCYRKSPQLLVQWKCIEVELVSCHQSNAKAHNHY